MIKYNNPIHVCVGIASLFEFTLKYTAALKVYGELYEETFLKNAYIELSHETIWRQLMSELSKIYDREQTCGSDNLSIRQLRKVCLDYNIFKNGEESDYIRKLDELQKFYEKLLSKNLRNKKVAHYDLVEMFSLSETTILFSEIENLVEDTSAALKSICEYFNITGLPKSYEDFVQIYREEFSMLYSL